MRANDETGDDDSFAEMTPEEIMAVAKDQASRPGPGGDLIRSATIESLSPDQLDAFITNEMLAELNRIRSGQIK